MSCCSGSEMPLSLNIPGRNFCSLEKDFSAFSHGVDNSALSSMAFFTLTVAFSADSLLYMRQLHASTVTYISQPF